MPKKQTKVSDYITGLNMNGLQGRMLRVPGSSNTSKELLFIYGHHSSLERWWGVIQDLNQYGTVTMPDLPGFGGMESFYKINQQPTIDNYADYLAAFIKLKYKRKKIIIFGLSFGFVIVTRMLQNYPELVKKVDLLVSVVGFSRYDDFKFSRLRMLMYKNFAKPFRYAIPAFVFKNTVLNPGVLRLVYHKTSNAKHKFKGMSKAKRERLMNFEIELWHANDVRTHMFTSVEFLQVDNCGVRIASDLWHIAVKNDNYFDNHVVEQHMSIIFKDVNVVYADLTNHAPSIIADKTAAAPLIPDKLRSLLK